MMKSKAGRVTGGIKEKVSEENSITSASSGYEETIGTTDSLCK
jgi:hypothetical protein